MVVHSLIDGQPATGIRLDDRALQYGDGLFETCVLRGGRIELLDRHLRRLEWGCERLGMPSPERALLLSELDTLIAGVAEGLIKVIVTRGSGGRGYQPPTPATPRRILALHPPVVYPAAPARDGVTLYPCRTRLGDQPALAGIKHLNRLEQVLARAEWSDPAMPEGLVRDQQGRPVEGTMSNLFVVRGDALITPDLTRCGVAGIMREQVLELADTRGLVATVEVRDLSADELSAADEVFVTNSVIRLWPVVAIGRDRYAVGRVTRRLQDAIRDVLDA